jgi:hypothetical protein
MSEMSKLQCHICKNYLEDDGFDLDESTGMLFTDCKACYDAWIVQISEREEEELRARMQRKMIRSD